MKKEEENYKKALNNYKKNTSSSETIFQKIMSYLFSPFLLLLLIIYGVSILFVSYYLFEIVFQCSMEDSPRLGTIFFAIIFWIPIYIICKIKN